MRALNIGINAIFRGKPTGVANYIIHLVDAITRLDGQNHYYIFVTESNRDWFAWNRDNVHEVLCPAEVDSALGRRTWELFRLGRMVRDMEIDILHCPTNILPFSVPCRTVVTILDCQFLASSLSHRYLRRMFNRLFIRRSFMKSDAVITLSHAMKQEIDTYYGSTGKPIRVTWLGQECAGAAPAEAEPAWLRRAFGLTEKYILFVGFPHARKNLVRLVQAFALARPRVGESYDLVLCGDCQSKEESDYANIVEAARQLGITEHVRFIDYVERTDLLRLMAGAELFAFPSLYEGFGLPVVEAMACGTAVLVSDIPVMREITDGAAVYVDPYDVDNMAQGLVSVLSNRPSREALRVKGSQVASRFTWEETARRTLECYREIGGKKGA